MNRAQSALSGLYSRIFRSNSEIVLKDRSNQQLLLCVKHLVGRELEATADVVAHLAEIDARDLFLQEGCSSLYKYCIEVLHLSEWAAYHRIDVARVARRFPVIFDKLAEGSIHLSTVRILGPCLTEENHLRLLEAAKHKSKEEVEKLAVSVRPKAEVTNTIRRLPGEKVAAALPSAEGQGLFEAGGGSEAAPKATALAQQSIQVGEGVAGVFVEDPAPGMSPVSGPPASSQKPAISPLAPERYKVQLMVDEETVQALKQLQELLRHRVPNGDLATIVKDAVLQRLEQVKRERLGQVKRPRGKSLDQVRGANPERNRVHAGAAPRISPSRHIPAEVKRAVVERDGGQCAFVSKSGRRCSERGRLEFHHVRAHALGGEATTENIALLCRAHNCHEAELLFGRNRKNLSRSGASSAGATTFGW